MKRQALAIAAGAALAVAGASAVGAATPAPPAGLAQTRAAQTHAQAGVADRSLVRVRDDRRRSRRRAHRRSHRAHRRRFHHRRFRRGARHRGVHRHHRRHLRRHHRRHFHHRRGPRLGFYFRWTTVRYSRCRRFYHLGFVRGIPRYRYLYVRHCRRYRAYGY